jgi:hypothetical protein
MGSHANYSDLAETGISNAKVNALTLFSRTSISCLYPYGYKGNLNAKTRLSEAIYDLNRGFAIALEVFDRLAGLGVLSQ